MLRTMGRSFDSLISVCAQCIVVAMVATGCGSQPASTIDLAAGGGNDEMPANDGGTEPDDSLVDQAPDGGGSADDPADATPDVLPPAEGDSDDGAVTGDDMPQNTYCEAVANWGETWIAFEDGVLELINQHRAQGAYCGVEGAFGATEPLTMNAALRCAARNHSLDMGTRDYFDHYTPEGTGPGERLDQADYSGSSWGENIAWGQTTPEAVVSAWMSSPGHCANIMRAGFTETGIGYYDGNFWTQTFGRP